MTQVKKESLSRNARILNTFDLQTGLFSAPKNRTLIILAFLDFCTKLNCQETRTIIKNLIIAKFYNM